MVPVQHESKTKLLEATLKVARVKGYSATRIEDIYAEARLTKRRFFHHFKSKEDLALSAAAHWRELTSRYFADAPHHGPADPLDRLLRKAILTGGLSNFSAKAASADTQRRSKPISAKRCENMA